jgi:ribonuclease T2
LFFWRYWRLPPVQAPGIENHLTPSRALLTTICCLCHGRRHFASPIPGLRSATARADTDSDAVVAGVSDIMPARGLVYHEWSAHGTCSGLDPADFFALVRRAYARIALPALLSGAGPEIERSPGAIAAEFLRANPKLSAPSIVVTCTGQDVPRLREVHICLDKGLEPRACSEDAARGACRAATLIVPPIR